METEEERRKGGCSAGSKSYYAKIIPDIQLGAPVQSFCQNMLRGSYTATFAGG